MPSRAKCRPETSDTAREFGIAGEWDSLRLHVLRELIKVDGAKTATKLNMKYSKSSKVKSKVKGWGACIDSFLSGAGGREGLFTHWAGGTVAPAQFIEADLQSWFIPTMKEPDSSCVVAIKMKSLYFVTQTFIFVFNISMSTSVNFCIRPMTIVYTNTLTHTKHTSTKRDSSLSLWRLNVV